MNDVSVVESGPDDKGLVEMNGLFLSGIVALGDLRSSHIAENGCTGGQYHLNGGIIIIDHFLQYCMPRQCASIGVHLVVGYLLTVRLVEEELDRKNIQLPQLPLLEQRH